MFRSTSKSLFATVLLSMILSACGGSSGLPEDDDPDFGITDTPEVIDGVVQRQGVLDESQLYVYRSESPYASVLKGCSQVESSTEACSLTTLPFIKQATPVFDRSDVMDRLLVTHNWMGERFEALINEAPDDMITLFGSVTAISIGSTIRPSNYWVGTGGIQLDPENLWLTVAEKANVSIEEDSRSGYGADLQFWNLGTLRDGDTAALTSYSLTNTTERTLDDIKIRTYRLLYHELAHAMDYLPTESFASLDATNTPYGAIYKNRSFNLSPRLVLDLPLYSDVLYRLGQVSFYGVDATEAETSVTPSDAGAEMAIDGAMRYYGYSTIREDFATLFAITMMKYHFGLDSYIGFTQKPVDEESYTCAELLVGWGSRNRLADPLVAPRAKWVFESIYGPNDEFDQFFSTGIGQSEAMTPGVDWCTNRDGVTVDASSPAGRSLDTSMSSDARRAQFEQLEMERHSQTH